MGTYVYKYMSRFFALSFLTFFEVFSCFFFDWSTSIEIATIGLTGMSHCLFQRIYNSQGFTSEIFMFHQRIRDVALYLFLRPYLMYVSWRNVCIHGALERKICAFTRMKKEIV